MRLFMVGMVLWGLVFANPQNNSLVVGASQEPNVLGGDFLGILSDLAVLNEIGGYYTAPLIGLNLEGSNFPVLVTELPTYANGRIHFATLAGGKRRLDINLSLRSGLKWSDGDPLDTKDILLYYEMGKARGMPVPNPDYWDRVSLRVSDALNFTVSFEPAAATDLIGSPIGLVPSHLMRDEWEKAKAATVGLDVAKDAERIGDIYTKFFGQFSTPKAINEQRLAYSGPFIPKRWIAGSSLEMVRNPNFALAPPGGSDRYIQKVVYRFFQNTASLLVAVLGGGIDATSTAGLDFDQLRSPQIIRRAPGRFDAWFVPGAIWEHIILNSYRSVQKVRELGLDDRRTRQALVLAMNREGLVKALFDGLQPVANTWMPPSWVHYNPKATAYAYDPLKARQLLGDLGWRAGPDGILQRSFEGRTVRFELEFVTTSGRALRERVQQFLSENLKQVGIAVRINNSPASSIVDSEYLPKGSQGTWTGGIMLAQFFSPTSMEGDLFACKNTSLNQDLLATEKNGFGGSNITGWCSDEYDALYSQVLFEFDEEKRKGLFARMQEIWAQEIPNIPLYWRTSQFITAKGLVNYVASTFSGGLGMPSWSSWNIGWESKGAQNLFNQEKYANKAADR